MAEEKKYSGYGYHGGGRKPKGEEPKTTTISIVCTPSEKKQIDKLTEECNLSRSQFILLAVNYFYETHQKSGLSKILNRCIN